MLIQQGCSERHAGVAAVVGALVAVLIDHQVAGRCEASGVGRRARLVHVYRYSVDKIESPEIYFTVLCSKGFYVRTYAHDIGELLGCGAHLKNLRRTQSGRFDVANAITVAQIKELPQ